MPYFLDGHNLLGQTPGLSLTDPADRRRLVAALAEFARARRCRMTVFFDGEAPERWRADLHLGAVRVVHAGRGRSADDAILEAIRSSRAPADVTLVTSDRSLYEKGRHLGAKGILGHRFRAMMKEASPRAAEKPERPDPGEVDYFLSAFGAAGGSGSEGGPAGAPSRSRRRR